MPLNRFPFLPRLALAAVALASLAACASFSGIEPVAQPRDAASLGLSFADPVKSGAEANIAADWWLGFGDGQLNQLIDQALATSPNLRLAQARLARAQAGADLVDSADKPRLDAAVDITHQRYTENGLYPAPLAGSIRDAGTVQLNGSWELDFFGKNRAALDAALGSVQAAQADAQAARILLASQVARSYFQLMRIQEQLGVAQRTLAQRSETLDLVRDRVNAGLDTRLELRQSEGGLPEARQQIEALQEQSALARHALSALVGQPHVADALVPPALSTVKIAAPITSSTQIPADLLGRRADIAAARWRVEAATRDTASAKAQFYPNINLIGFVGLSSIGLGQLANAGSLQWGVGPALRLPIFDAGRLRANLRGKTADLDAAVESYNASVLDAVRDVADQLASSQSIARQQAEQQQAESAAEGAYEIAVQRYRAGLGTYLNVLTAETNVLQQRRQRVDLAARALDTQVALIRALGGGYAPTAPASLAAAPAAAPKSVAVN
ncbi:RND transporter [Rhodoferax koreense]|uniref:RND transporter n=1 Tax=Rhodoferax koreensis TaxID=1842727 RepID=A0A1P8JYB4_9BURK|nr:efflux transporter outer membrane subunit [Rhodoferax koreense]APW38725.1 RND transporter [Rhodoferax koreense]